MSRAAPVAQGVAASLDQAARWLGGAALIAIGVILIAVGAVIAAGVF